MDESMQTLAHIAIEVFFVSAGVFALWVIVTELRKVIK